MTFFIIRFSAPSHFALLHSTRIDSHDMGLNTEPI
jgi:hypothetical protein